MAKKKTTRARLVEHAAAAKRGPTTTPGPTKRPAQSGGTATGSKAPAARAIGASAGAGALEIPGLPMDDIQETVRRVVTYVQQNPLAAAAVAIGVGVMLTSMYWDNRGDASGKQRGAR